ncbi:Smc5-6 complex SMC subunit Smc6 [Rhizoctonia solani AG-1 IA]|uniref:Smc5-6 complex SMC subunit Smc6 n=2 Tax=Rhizoctonia solani TaxID=456999 RepID=L8X5P6_THACA|nr:Smc5-6 complex SMC subunit Smc6 [Rhizoctonia solani AG-1 IA]
MANDTSMPRRKRDEDRASSPVEKPKTPHRVKRTRVLSPVSPDNHLLPQHELDLSIPSHIRRLVKGKYVQSGSGFIDMTCDADETGDSSGSSDTSIHVRMDVVRFDWPSRFTQIDNPRAKTIHNRGDSTPDRFIPRHDDSVLRSTPRSARLARHVEFVVDGSGPAFEQRMKKATAKLRLSKQAENIGEESFARRVMQAGERDSQNPFLQSDSDSRLSTASTLRQLPHERALLLRSASSLIAPPKTRGPSPSSQFHMQRAPIHVYDAPEILEDYYSSPFAWSTNDTFACALGSAVFFSKVSGNRLLNIEQLRSAPGLKSAVEWCDNALAVGQTDGSLSLYDTATKRQTSALLPSSPNSSQICALSWTGNLLAAGLDGAALLWDIRQPSRSTGRQPITKLTTHGPHKVCGIKWRPDGEMLATSGDDNAVCVWDMRTLKKPLIKSTAGRVAWKKKGHCSAVKALAWCPWSPTVLASGGGKSDGTVNFWSAQTGTLKHTLSLGSQITSIFFSPVCREIVTTHGFRAPSRSPLNSSSESALSNPIEEVETANSIITHTYPSLNRLTHVPNLHGMRISHASLSPDGSRLMTGGTFEALVMWSVWGAAGKREETSVGNFVGLIRQVGACMVIQTCRLYFSIVVQSHRRSRPRDLTHFSTHQPPEMAKRAANGAVSEAESVHGQPHDSEDEHEEEEPRSTQPTLTQAQRDLAIGDDEAFEAKYRDQVRREIEEKGYGIIEKIEVCADFLVNFMCHARTTVQFGPQINFVIGHNGSGKSAVLSGIAIALGGRTASTGRGTGLKSFIKEGEKYVLLAAAEVAITLKNEGPDAYRPDIYGEAIRVSRRFTDKGSSSYAIKGAKDKFKKTISSKREELTNITDHMNLQVDNPVVVLTQDTSRQFLASSKPKDKYQFFLNGTSLTQLSDEYETILESLKKTETILQSKQTVVPDLKRQFTEAQGKYREAQAAQQQSQRVDDLEKELAWAHMKRKKIQMEALVTDHETGKKNVEKAQSHVDGAKVRAVTLSGLMINSVNQQEAEDDNAGSLEEQRRRIREDMKSKKDRLREAKSQMSEMNNALQQCNSAIKELTEKINVEEAKLQDDRRGLREKLNSDMERVSKQSKIEESNLSECQANIKNLSQLIQTKQTERREVIDSREKLREAITSVQHNIKRLEDSQRNAINRFGSNLHRALVDIDRHAWKGQKPLGPLGQYVDLKDGRWAELMRIYLGGLMASFAVTDARDREPLSKILQNHGNTQPNIIVAEVDLFDYSRGEPPAEVLTPLRILTVKHEWVIRLMINSAFIERTCLTRTRAEAQQLLDTVQGVNVVLSADLMRSQKYPDGGFFTSGMRKLRSEDRANWYFTATGSDEQIRIEREKLASLEEEYKSIEPRLNEIDTEGKKSETNIRAKVFKLKDERARLNEQAEEEAPASVQGLQEARKEEEERKQSILDQFKAVAEREAVLNSELKPLVEKLDNIRKQAEQTERRNIENKRKLEPLLERRLMAVKKVEHYQKKLEDAMKDLEEAAQAEGIVVTEYDVRLSQRKSLTISQPIETDRTPESIDAEIEIIKKALRDRERRHGQSIEEIAQEVQSTQEALDKTRQELKSIKSFNKGLQLAMNLRLDTWHIFRRHISLRTNIWTDQYLLDYLGQRGYRGSIDFDHKSHTLDLRVITDEANPHAKDKDPKALSGGEKSFSTICLLMSLWEALGCPIRCLDEFDVFMDQVNRHIAMQTMVRLVF